VGEARAGKRQKGTPTPVFLVEIEKRWFEEKCCSVHMKKSVGHQSGRNRRAGSKGNEKRKRETKSRPDPLRFWGDEGKAQKDKTL